MRLLVTRPEPDGERTAARLRQMGHDAVAIPAMRTESIAAAWGPGPFAAVVFTSLNAVRALASHPGRAALTSVPAFAVGARTAEAARAVGFSSVVSADGDAADLTALLGATLAGHSTGKPARLLYLAGEHRAVDLGAALAPQGIAVETVAVYRAVAAEDFPGRLREALASGPLDGVLHYSRRSAAAFLAGADAAGLLAPALAVRQFCLSDAVATVLAGAGAVEVAARPDEASLFGLLNRT